jgi:hypothetical protein
MATKSAMTIERGLGENTVITIQNFVEQMTGQKTCINVWHSKKDSSWNINVYKSSGPKATYFQLGKGWDMLDAIEKLRVNFLVWASERLELTEVAKNTFEIQKVLDERSGNTRNEVGAVESDTPDWLEANNKILNEIDFLKASFTDILSAINSLKK